MSKRNETRPTNRQEGNGRDVSLTDRVNVSPKSKKVALEIQYDTYLGEKVPYVLDEGKKRYPVNAVGRLFGYDEKHETQLFERNKEILQGNAYPLTVRGKERAVSVWCIDSVGLLILTGRADLEKLPEPRREIVIKIVHFMAESADMRLRGDLISKDGLIPPDNPEQWLKSRKNAATNWNRLCKVLKIKVVPTIKDPAHERFVYINEAKMLNKNVYGRHQKGIRDRSTIQQIEALENAEAWDTAFLHLNILEKDKRDLLIDDMLIRHYPDLDLERILPEPVQTIQISASPGQRVLIEFMAVV